MTFLIAGRVPSKKNGKQIVRAGNGNTFLLSKEGYRNWEEATVLELKSKARGTHFALPTMTLRFYPPDRRPADLNNLSQGILDAFVLAGIIPDDNMFVLSHLTQHFVAVDPQMPRVEVEITETLRDSA